MTKQKTDAATETITKAEAVRRAVAAGKIKPADGVQWIKEQFGIELSRPAFSTNRFQIERASERKGLTLAGAGRRTAPPALLPSESPPAGKPESPAELARQVKQLIAAFGAPAVSDMVAVLAD